MNYIFVVTLRGKGVWHNCQLQFGINDTNDETLEKVRQKIEKETNLKVYEFDHKFGSIEAWTSNDDVKVFIEGINVL